MATLAAHAAAPASNLLTFEALKRHTQRNPPSKPRDCYTFVREQAIFRNQYSPPPILSHDYTKAHGDSGSGDILSIGEVKDVGREKRQKIVEAIKPRRSKTLTTEVLRDARKSSKSRANAKGIKNKQGAKVSTPQTALSSTVSVIAKRRSKKSKYKAPGSENGKNSEEERRKSILANRRERRRARAAIVKDKSTAATTTAKKAGKALGEKVRKNLKKRTRSDEDVSSIREQFIRKKKRKRESRDEKPENVGHGRITLNEKASKLGVFSRGAASTRIRQPKTKRCLSAFIVKRVANNDIVTDLVFSELKFLNRKQEMSPYEDYKEKNRKKSKSDSSSSSTSERPPKINKRKMTGRSQKRIVFEKEGTQRKLTVKNIFKKGHGKKEESESITSYESEEVTRRKSVRATDRRDSRKSIKNKVEISHSDSSDQSILSQSSQESSHQMKRATQRSTVLKNSKALTKPAKFSSTRSSFSSPSSTLSNAKDTSSFRNHKNRLRRSPQISHPTRSTTFPKHSSSVPATVWSIAKAAPRVALASHSAYSLQLRAHRARSERSVTSVEVEKGFQVPPSIILDTAGRWDMDVVDLSSPRTHPQSHVFQLDSPFCHHNSIRFNEVNDTAPRSHIEIRNRIDISDAELSQTKSSYQRVLPAGVNVMHRIPDDYGYPLEPQNLYEIEIFNESVPQEVLLLNSSQIEQEPSQNISLSDISTPQDVIEELDFIPFSTGRSALLDMPEYPDHHSTEVQVVGGFKWYPSKP